MKGLKTDDMSQGASDPGTGRRISMTVQTNGDFTKTYERCLGQD